MQFHRHAKLRLAWPRELVLAIADGRSVRQVAADFNASPAAAHRWWWRSREAGQASAQVLAVCLSVEPTGAQSKTAAAGGLAIDLCDYRHKTAGAGLARGHRRLCASTVWNVVRLVGLLRPP